METESNYKNPKHERKELTLLLLGATGSGKSTFINAIANYLTYETLEEALESTPVNLIPLKFSQADENYDPHSIQVGVTDENEDLESGTSATQAARTYTFTSTDILLRCVDTPGIGDVRGKDQDKVNFELIMEHLNYLSSINGICIFIEPNNPRINEYFAFCIDELFKHLHKDACKNIVFVFPKSRGNDYKPGDALPTLKKFIGEKKYEGITLNKSTLYCIDNESIRLLAMHANKFKVDKKEKKNCNESWDESTQEIHRLISHVSAITPHSIKNTVCLNEAMNTVYALVEPMLQICENLNKNIEMLKKKKEGADSWGSGDALKANLKIPKIVMESVTVNPKLVCASSKCTQKTMVEGALVEKYACCHDNCYIKGLKFLNKVMALNRFCEVMNEGVCTKCWCSWKVHKHVTCDYEEKIVMVEPDEDTKTIADFISQLDESVQKHQGERDKIIDIGAKLGIFLDQNSIRRNNDAIVDQIKQSIAFEDDVIRSGGSEAKKASLQSLLDMYQSQKKKLQSDGIRVFPNDAHHMINSLYSLPSNGETIKKSVQAVLNANDKRGIKTEIVLTCRRAINALQSKWNLLAKS